MKDEKQWLVGRGKCVGGGGEKAVCRTCVGDEVRRETRKNTLLYSSAELRQLKVGSQRQNVLYILRTRNYSLNGIVFCFN